ncbi:MAG: restriction endonuclease subunit S [Candidatus Zixiibacteriota bacterium]
MGNRLHNWKGTKLGAVCVKIGSGATPRGGAKVYIDKGVSLIRSQNVQNSGFKMNGLAHISDIHARQLDGVTVEHQDVLLNITGDSVARTCQVDASILPARVNQHVAIIRSKNEYLIPRYLRYALVQPCMQQHLLGLASSGATRNALTKQMIEDLELLLPPLPEQKAIAAVLSSLDDKIELLRRQNETFEEIAQTIFMEWFVEFNFPDKKGKPYKANGGKMVDSELGPIPKGWRLVSLYDVAKYINGAAFRQDDFSLKNSGLPIIKIAELKDGLTANTKYTEKSVSEDIVLQDDDILFSWSGSPETSIDIFVWHLGKGILNQHTFRVIPHGCTEKVWVYNLLRHYKSLFVELAKQKQTTGLGHVTVTDLKDTKTVCPDEGLLARYNEVAQPLFSKYCLNLKSMHTLARTRDTLLPKLMSGALRVKGDIGE